jgi:hypothetical protein
VLWENVLPGHQPGSGPTYDIHRLKGRFFGDDGSEKIIQGVREIFDIFDSPSQPQPASNVPRVGKLVLIGRHLGDYDFRKSLEDAIRGVRPV